MPFELGLLSSFQDNKNMLSTKSPVNDETCIICECGTKPLPAALSVMLNLKRQQVLKLYIYQISTILPWKF